MAAGKHTLDLPSSSGISSRRALRREQLRNELAQYKTGFFLNVHRNMSHRMYPALPPKVGSEALLVRGVSAPLYLERFGSYTDEGHRLDHLAGIDGHVLPAAGQHLGGHASPFSLPRPIGRRSIPGNLPRLPVSVGPLLLCSN